MANPPQPVNPPRPVDAAVDPAARAQAGAPPSIRRVLVLANAANPEVRRLLGNLAPWLGERVDSVHVEEDVRAFCEAREELRRAGAELEVPDLVAVLGGDGAMLAAVRAFRERPVPTFGINFGRVGFLASTPASRWREVLGGVLQGGGVHEPRMRLSVEGQLGGGTLHSVALNDVVVQRRSTQGLMTVSLWVGELWVTNYRADGLVAATPTGSTAYSLAAGGPILDPALDGVVVTPLCSQGLSNRPIVLQPDSHLSVRVEVAEGGAGLVLDGQDSHEMQAGDTVRLQRHPQPYPLLAMPGLDPYRRLRSRLGWGSSG